MIDLIEHYRYRFGEIVERWGIPEGDINRLLTAIDRPQLTGTMRLIEQIYAYLHKLYGEQRDIDLWARTPVSASPFSGRTPLDYWLSGERDTLERTIDYLDLLIRVAVE